MIAIEFLGEYKPTCVFHNYQEAAGSSVCGKPAVAVYVTNDHLRNGQYVCQEHAAYAEINGDGPVFWQQHTLCGAKEGRWVCNRVQGHPGDHIDADPSGGCVGWPQR